VKLTEVNEPWKHYIIDDFLPEQEFDELKNIVSYRPTASDTDRYNVFWDTNADNLPECLKTCLKQIKELLIETGICESEKDYEDVGFHLEYNSVGKDYNFGVHTDQPRKFASGVLYVNPEECDGTAIHNRDKSFNYQVEWKPNRMLFFKREDWTWHDYKNSFRGRQTINIICDNEFMEVPSHIRSFRDE
jgi:hypothetical protein